MTVHELPGFLRQHWAEIREHLLTGTYTPQPVKRVEIPKPDGGVRKLGIPTVLDRFIQQAVMQVLQGRWDRTFSDHSYDEALQGLRRRRAPDAFKLSHPSVRFGDFHPSRCPTRFVGRPDSIRFDTAFREQLLRGTYKPQPVASQRCWIGLSSRR